MPPCATGATFAAAGMATTAPRAAAKRPRSDMCAACGDKRANYGLPGQPARWCAGCGRPRGATHTYDHKLARCRDCGLVKSPKYGLPGDKPLWCKPCGDKRGAVLLRGLCVDCGLVCACYNLPGKKNGKWCAACALPHGGVALYARRCEACGITYLKGHHTVCASCDTSGTRPSRVREKQVAKWLLDAGMRWTSWDKQLPESSCGRYRPDFTFEVATHVVVLEVDEFEHARPGYECDNRRMLDVYNAYGGMPVVFVRYNPDTPEIDGRRRAMPSQRRKGLLVSEVCAALRAPPVHPLSIVRVMYSGRGVVQRSWVDPYDARFTEHAID